MSQRRFCSGLPLTPILQIREKRTLLLLKMELWDKFLLLNYLVISLAINTLWYCLELQTVLSGAEWVGKYFPFCAGGNTGCPRSFLSFGSNHMWITWVFVLGVLYTVFLASKYQTQWRNCCSFFCKGQRYNLMPKGPWHTSKAFWWKLAVVCLLLGSAWGLIREKQTGRKKEQNSGLSLCKNSIFFCRDTRGKPLNNTNK